ncbi:MAG TPA: type II toxin-antitoxin system Phd/YefM family antitoxin [Deltaproteobacteria bacterium]|jgi:antitoxin (DNA-binding transcriptional repressor) of toxin-antitoxin stability system|nr:type II toxin-antitoxin system Phd/YefM family antitoxin [Deltaproteobacteria bacterium]
MKTVSFTEFRKHASNLFSDVENGEMLVVVRHGKPIAEIKPFTEKSNRPSWKKPGLRLSIKGAQLSSAILEERERENLS